MNSILKFGPSIIPRQGYMFGSYVNGLEIHQVVAVANAMWLGPNVRTGKVDPTDQKRR